jgi:TP53 regulating kinase-like protein
VKELIQSGQLQGPALVDLCTKLGQAVAGIHNAGVVHGDLTTSNMIAQNVPSAVDGSSAADTPQSLNVVMIDFGLGFQSTSTEDQAVDLYVLERAFTSTHLNSAHLVTAFIDAYFASRGKASPAVQKKLEGVRARGRKRTMLG